MSDTRHSAPSRATHSPPSPATHSVPSATAVAPLPVPRSGQPDRGAPDPDRLGALVGRAVGDLGAFLSVPLVLVGDRLGLWAALDAAESVTSAELAETTGLHERYLREWLLTMAASGYLTYRGSGRYALDAEQAEAFAHPDSPAYVTGGFQSMPAAVRALDRLTEAFRSGAGIGWHEHHEDLFVGTERLFRPGYLAHLVAEWIPALDGLDARLRAGARVVDVGCGLGASTRIMAAAYPESSFLGTDYHEGSVALARERAAEAGLDRIEFRVGSAAEVSGSHDLVTMFDCLHDMPDPAAALRATRSAVADDGWVLLVEPVSGDRVEDSLNPVGRLFAGASMFLCLPSGLSAEPRTGLGSQAGPARTMGLARDAGFSRVRVAATTPLNLVYELRP